MFCYNFVVLNTTGIKNSGPVLYRVLNATGIKNSGLAPT